VLDHPFLEYVPNRHGCGGVDLLHRAIPLHDLLHLGPEAQRNFKRPLERSQLAVLPLKPL